MRLNERLFIRAGIAAGFLLSLASELNLCPTAACTEVHKYALFGISLPRFGLLFFFTAGAAYELGRYYRIFSNIFCLMIIGASGAEIALILIQKFEVKQWCPLCIAIAVTVYIIAILISFMNIRDAISTFKEKKAMATTLSKRVLILSLILTVGFLVAHKGAQKSEAEESIPNIFLGNKDSSLEVYIITDWFCPACRKAEQEIEKTVPAIGKRAKIVFVDLPVHAETFNYTPYNLSFLAYEKDKYLDLRKALITLTAKTKEPTTEDVQKAISPLRVTYRSLPFLSLNRAIKFYEEVPKSFKVSSTPTVVVSDTKTKNKTVLVGVKDITEANILRALDEVSQRK